LDQSVSGGIRSDAGALVDGALPGEPVSRFLVAKITAAAIAADPMAAPAAIVAMRATPVSPLSCFAVVRFSTMLSPSSLI
jgi:hypothetical protein